MSVTLQAIWAATYMDRLLSTALVTTTIPGMDPIIIPILRPTATACTTIRGQVGAWDFITVRVGSTSHSMEEDITEVDTGDHLCTGRHIALRITAACMAVPRSTTTATLTETDRTTCTTIATACRRAMFSADRRVKLPAHLRAIATPLSKGRPARFN